MDRKRHWLITATAVVVITAAVALVKQVSWTGAVIVAVVGSVVIGANNIRFSRKASRRGERR